jgi:hypothetical protein
MCLGAEKWRTEKKDNLRYETEQEDNLSFESFESCDGVGGFITEMKSDAGRA